MFGLEGWAEFAEFRELGGLGEEICFGSFVSVGDEVIGSDFGFRGRVAARAFVFVSCRLARDFDEDVEVLLSLESDRFIACPSASISDTCELFEVGACCESAPPAPDNNRV